MLRVELLEGIIVNLCDLESGNGFLVWHQKPKWQSKIQILKFHHN